MRTDKKTVDFFTPFVVVAVMIVVVVVVERYCIAKLKCKSKPQLKRQLMTVEVVLLAASARLLDARQLLVYCCCCNYLYAIYVRMYIYALWFSELAKKKLIIVVFVVVLHLYTAMQPLQIAFVKRLVWACRTPLLLLFIFAKATKQQHYNLILYFVVVVAVLVIGCCNFCAPPSEINCQSVAVVAVDMQMQHL